MVECNGQVLSELLVGMTLVWGQSRTYAIYSNFSFEYDILSTHCTQTRCSWSRHKRTQILT